MARKIKNTAPVADVAEQIAVAEIDRQIALSNSKVKPLYKMRYKANALARGGKGKAEKRMNGDWLSQQMKALVLTKKEKLDVEKLQALCEANGLHDIAERWPNRNTGWEGRLRMTSCLVLRKIVADNAVLHVPGEDDRLN
jgi:hypothetical protein